MADKSDLKAELERKKQCLAQIREEKKRKEKEKESETQQKAEAAPEDSDLHRKHRETKALLEHWNLTRTSIRYSCVIFWVCFKSLNGTSSKPLFRQAFPVFSILHFSLFATLYVLNY
uniref:Dynein cytoplasmic 1 intermediate chain 1 n=1 Tax=Sinocyclocheilus grahami TaxID=75366 RepID=A0A672QA61_SINGR